MVIVLVVMMRMMRMMRIRRIRRRRRWRRRRRRRWRRRSGDDDDENDDHYGDGDSCSCALPFGRFLANSQHQEAACMTQFGANCMANLKMP